MHREARRRPGGRARRAELAARGVELVGPSAEGPTGVVVSIVHDGDRSLASDRGVAPSFAPEELDPAWVACDVLHLSGYALLREPIAATALLAARLAREQGARVSVDVAAWTEIRSYGPVQFRELLDELEPDVLFATEAEWELLGGAYLSAPVGVLKRERVVARCSPRTRTRLLGCRGRGGRPDRRRRRARRGRPSGRFPRRSRATRLEAAARCVANVGSLP